MVFPVVLYGCESWTIKKADCWRIDAFELRCCRTLESPLNCKEIQTVSPKGNQSWIFIGRTYAEAPILWLPDAENWLIGKYPDAWKDWRQEKGMTEDEMFGLFHEMDAQLYEHEFGQALGVCDRQGSLALLHTTGWQRVRPNGATSLNWW